MNFYRYSRVSNYSLAGLAASTCWFSSHRDFNDPFEGRVKILKNHPKAFLTRTDAEAFYNKMRAYFSELGVKQRVLDEIDQCRSLKHRLQKSVTFLKDPITNAINGIVESHGYCCFCKGENSDVLLNHLMWAHYADGLRGFCMVFDEVELHSSLKSLNDLSDLVLCPVTYSNKLPTLNFIDEINSLLDEREIEDQDHDFYVKVCSTKSSAWKYEKEWRAISPKIGLHAFSPESLKKIVIGEKMPLDMQTLLRAVVATKYPHVEVHIAYMKDDSYKLHMREST